MEAACGQRIVIVGSSGSGKTTLARQIAAELDMLHVELDAVYWQENWKTPTRDEFRSRVSEALQGDCWVVDGNHSEIRDITWERGDTLIWLDYPLRVVFTRLGRRTVGRLFKRQLLLNKNRKSWREQYLNRHSKLFYLIKTYRKRRRQYHHLIGQPEYAHLKVIRLRSPRETKRWFAEFILHEPAEPSNRRRFSLRRPHLKLRKS